jgi:hypothetical protein
MANSSISLTSLDFDSYKASLKDYLKSQDVFKDYDFEGSNINVLLDVLSYNTYLNAFYLNMISNEMFIDTAQLKDSMVSHSKELNYVPRSFRSAYAVVNITVTSSDITKKSIVMPKGTAFTTRVGNRSFTFTTSENLVATSPVVSGSTATFTFAGVRIYEGDYVTDNYSVSYDTSMQYKLSNKNVDISSLTVTVIEDNGIATKFNRATSLFGIESTTEVFFVQPALNDSYEIIFGDGIIGRKPKNNSVIIVEYRICNGELPNGARVFRAAESIESETNINVSTSSAAIDGAISESVESIRYNAPRAFTTQERAVTAEDYENLLKANFPEINAVSAYGGEEANPPQFGKVFVTVDLTDVDGLPNIKKDEYYKFLKSRSSVSIDPVFLSPDYLYLYVNSIIKYNINTTSLNPDDIRTLVISAMLEYAGTNLNNFNRTMRFSRFLNAIDNAESSIVSNETFVEVYKPYVPILNSPQTFEINFTVPLLNTTPVLADEHPLFDIHTVRSSKFTFRGQQCTIEDNGDGVLRVVTPDRNNHKKVIDIGTVNYDTGLVQISNFAPTNYEGTSLKFYGVTRTKDITSSKNVILNILEPDIDITVEQVRI